MKIQTIVSRKRTFSRDSRKGTFSRTVVIQNSHITDSIKVTATHNSSSSFNIHTELVTFTQLVRFLTISIIQQQSESSTTLVNLHVYSKGEQRPEQNEQHQQIIIQQSEIRSTEQLGRQNVRLG